MSASDAAECNGRDAPIQVALESPPPGNTLWVRVTDEEDRPILGNLFPVLTHIPSDCQWLEIRYRRAQQAYSFDNLPSGPYRLRVSAAGFTPAETTFTLEGGTRKTLHLPLVRRVGQDQLLLDVGDEVASLAEQVADLPPGRRADLGWALSDESLLASILIQDNRLRQALTAPLDAWSGIEGLEDHFARRLAWLGFPYERSANTMRLYWKLVDSRSRLAISLTALFANPHVAAYVRIPEDADIGQILRQVIDGFDLLEIDNVLLVLARLHAPWRLVIEETARSQIGPFNLLIPPGIAKVMRRDRTRPPALRPDELPRGWDEATNRLGSADQRIVQLVQVLVGAVATVFGTGELRGVQWR